MPDLASGSARRRQLGHSATFGPGGLAAVAEEVLAQVAGGRLAAQPLALGFWDGSRVALGAAPPVATVLVRGPAAIARVLRHPSAMGLAEAWIAGELELQGDLPDVIALRDRLADVRFSWPDRVRLLAAATRLGARGLLGSPRSLSVQARQAGARHSERRDRAAIRHHYDVSNRFYKLFLGPSMSYSCGVFATEEDSLELAQDRKHEVICQRLRLRADERMLDVGCGWGSLLLHAVRHHGVRGVGITLAESQAQLARERIRLEGFSDQIEIRIADYRQLSDGPYDKIASVGMYEHVGAENYLRYLQKIRSLLRPGGRFLNDGVARLFSNPPRGETLISRYVFPDGEIHPLASLLAKADAAGLEVLDAHSLRHDYVLTLQRWYANLERRREAAVREVGEPRVRVWELYLAGCAHAFARGDETNFHVVATRPSA